MRRAADAVLRGPTRPGVPVSLQCPPLLRALWPAPLHVGVRERVRAAAGGALGILFTGLLCRWLGLPLQFSPWLIAPLGASAVLVFTVPSSPLGQPWAVIGGNTLSALVGVTCVLLIPDPAWAGAVAVGMAIVVMLLLRCLHPSGGATALLVVLSQVTHYRFALLPVFLDSLILVLAAVIYHSLTGRRYPHAQGPAQPVVDLPAPRFTRADFDAALAHYNQVIDVSRDDLESLLHYAEASAYGRRLGELRCADVMARKAGSDGVAMLWDQQLGAEEQVARQEQYLIELLPMFFEGGHPYLRIVDAERRLVGIITQADLLRALHQSGQ